MFATAIAGMLLALTLCAPPGPVAMETVRRGMRGGFRPALYVQFGSVVGDMFWCLLALAGLAPLVQIDWVRMLLAVAGIGVLFYLGATGIRDAVKSAGPAVDLHKAADGKGAFRSGMAISMANPTAVAFWLSFGGLLVAAGVAGNNVEQTATFLAGYVGATLAWCFVMALAVRWGKEVFKPIVFRWVTFACSATLVVMGVSLAWTTFQPLLS